MTTAIKQAVSFKAEFAHDFVKLNELLTASGIHLEHTQHPFPNMPGLDLWIDAVIDFDVEILRDHMRQVPDGHRMLQTLELVALKDHSGEIRWGNC